MNKDQWLEQKITEHLVSCGANSLHANAAAKKGVVFFKNQVCNSKDPFKDACDHAGKAVSGIMGKAFKYKQPGTRNAKGSKRPQEAFNF